MVKVGVVAATLLLAGCDFSAVGGVPTNDGAVVLTLKDETTGCDYRLVGHRSIMNRGTVVLRNGYFQKVDARCGAQ